MKQQSLFIDRVSREFGGSLSLKGCRKTARPLTFNSPIHLVLKASRPIQLFLHRRLIQRQIEKLSQKLEVRIHSSSVHEDHVHILVRFSSRQSYRAWIRSLTGTLCRQIKGLKWMLLPYTKLMKWGRQIETVLAYLKNNEIEAEFLAKAWQSLRTRPKSVVSLSSAAISPLIVTPSRIGLASPSSSRLDWRIFA